MATVHSAPASAAAGLSSPRSETECRTRGFDINLLNSIRRGSTRTQRILDNPYWLFGLLRFVAPVCRIPVLNWTVVTRFDHVRNILAQDQVFRVPWGDKTKTLNADEETFLLGVDNIETHRLAQQQLMAVFRLEDVKTVASLADEYSRGIIEAHRGRPLDAIRDLVTRVPTLICRKYYGIPIPQGSENDFAHWSIAMSTFMFGDPTDDPTIRDLALAAGTRMRALLDAAIKDAHQGKIEPDSVLDRFVRMQGSAKPTDTAIRAHLMGMVAGFVPTNTMAAGHMLEVLVGGGKYLYWPRGKFTRAMKLALDSRDDGMLTRCLLETLRFKPINPGPFRICVEDYTIEGGGLFGLRPKTITKNSKILASTQAAMFDSRRVERPYFFKTDRPGAEYLLFGSGMHVCLGLFLAKAQITSTLKALLSQRNLRRAKGQAGRLKRIGPFPAHLVVEYD
jgi:cytochrome P450